MDLKLEAEDAHEIASALWKSRKGMANRVEKLTDKYGDAAQGISTMGARITRIDALIKLFEDAGHFRRYMHQPARD